MRELPFERICHVLSQLSCVEVATLNNLMPKGEALAINHYTTNDGETFDESLTVLANELRSCGLPLAAMPLERLVAIVLQFTDGVGVKSDSWEIVRLAQEFRSRIIDASEELGFLVVDTEGKSLLSRGSAFEGVDWSKFGGSAAEIQEAGKCLALRRNKACVFHLMLALEEAVQIWAAQTGNVQTHDPHKGTWYPWLKICAHMRDQHLNKMSEGEEKQKALQVHAMLQTVGQVWRNPTSHPGETFSEELTLDIYTAVRAFFRSLNAVVSQEQSS